MSVMDTSDSQIISVNVYKLLFRQNLLSELDSNETDRRNFVRFRYVIKQLCTQGRVGI